MKLVSKQYGRLLKISSGGCSCTQVTQAGLVHSRFRASVKGEQNTAPPRPAQPLHFHPALTWLRYLNDALHTADRIITKNPEYVVARRDVAGSLATQGKDAVIQKCALPNHEFTTALGSPEATTGVVTADFSPLQISIIKMQFRYMRLL